MGFFGHNEAKEYEQNQFKSLLSRWINHPVDSSLLIKYQTYKPSIYYADKNVLSSEEKILEFIGCYFGKYPYVDLFGVLIATDQRLLFVQDYDNKTRVEKWKYSNVKAIDQGEFPLKRHEIALKIGRAKKIFGQIKKDNQYWHFIQILNQKMNESPMIKLKKKIDPVDEIRKFKGLLDDGIITQEEFNAKKEQLLGL